MAFFQIVILLGQMDFHGTSRFPFASSLPAAENPVEPKEENEKDDSSPNGTDVIFQRRIVFPEFKSYPS